MMQYASKVSKRNAKDISIDDLPVSPEDPRSRPLSSFGLGIKREQEQYLMGVQPAIQIMKQFEDPNSYSQKLITRINDKDLELLLKDEIKGIKEKFYGKLDASDSRKRGGFQQDLIEFVHANRTGQTKMPSVSLLHSGTQSRFANDYSDSGQHIRSRFRSPSAHTNITSAEYVQ